QETSIDEKLKIEIARLQTLYVKVAIEDSGFIHDSSHAAKRVLSIFAKWGMRWKTSDKMISVFIYENMVKSIDIILREYHQNPSIFKSEYEKLTKQESFIESKFNELLKKAEGVNSEQ